MLTFCYVSLSFRTLVLFRAFVSFFVLSLISFVKLSTKILSISYRDDDSEEGGCHVVLC